MELAKHYLRPYEDANTVLIWFLKLDRSDFEAMKLPDTSIDDILAAQRNARTLHHKQTYGQAPERFWIKPQNAKAADSLQVGDRLVILPDAERSRNSFSVYTLWGELIGSYQWPQKALPPSWLHPQEIDVRVTQIKSMEDGECKFEIIVEVV